MQIVVGALLLIRRQCSKPVGAAFGGYEQSVIWRGPAAGEGWLRSLDLSAVHRYYRSKADIDIRCCNFFVENFRPKKPIFADLAAMGQLSKIPLTRENRYADPTLKIIQSMLRLEPTLGHRTFVHKFPSNMPPGEALSVTIGDIKKGLLDSNSLIIKPHKQPKQKRQARSTLVEMEFGQRVIVQELRVDLTTAEISVVGHLHSTVFLYPQLLVPQRSNLTTYYERKGKKKILHAYFQGPGHAFANIDRVFELYDRVYCVDTNTEVARNGSLIAVTTAITVTSKKIGDSAIHISSDNTIELVATDPPPGNPEVHGIWMMLAHTWKNHPQLLQGKLAIITDTELGKIKAWNERVEPFHDGHMLPDGVDIFYASADAGSEEFLPNQLMRTCDSLSTRKLREML